jgi:GNAT superfamily N-acetyltransferase
MGVRLKHQRKNVGSMLLNAFEKEMMGKNISNIQVYTLGDSVDYKPYEQKRNFYYKNGFKEYSRIKTSNKSCPKELFLRKNLV